jgi:hypothetical protein
VVRLDFDAALTPYDDGLYADGDLSLHTVTSSPVELSSGAHVVRFENITDVWNDVDDLDLRRIFRVLRRPMSAAAGGESGLSTSLVGAQSQSEVTDTPFACNALRFSAWA